MAEQAQETEESLLEEISEQLQRAGHLLTGDLEAAAEVAFEDIVDNPKVASRIMAGLTDLRPLARPDEFAAAHRRVMRSLEILDRDGARDPRVPNLGPLKAVTERAVEFVMDSSLAGTRRASRRPCASCTPAGRRRARRNRPNTGCSAAPVWRWSAWRVTSRAAEGSR